MDKFSMDIAYLLIYFILQYSGAIAKFNCSQPPNLGNYDVNSCCRIPEINLGSATKVCDEHVKSLMQRQRVTTMPATMNSENNFPTYLHVCYPECIYRETGSLVNGKIYLKNVKKFLQDNVQQRDKAIVTHIVNSFESCLANVSSHMASRNIGMYAKLPDGCSPYAGIIYACVNVDTFVHCPAGMWKNEPQCNLAKSFIEQCNPLPHVPLPNK